MGEKRERRRRDGGGTGMGAWRVRKRDGEEKESRRECCEARCALKALSLRGCESEERTSTRHTTHEGSGYIVGYIVLSSVCVRLESCAGKFRTPAEVVSDGNYFRIVYRAARGRSPRAPAAARAGAGSASD
jgi:hypothetical protein